MTFSYSFHCHRVFMSDSQANIRNPLCYLLITLLAATAAYVSEGAYTPPDTSKSPTSIKSLLPRH